MLLCSDQTWQASFKHMCKSEEGWIRHFIRATGLERLSRHPNPSRLNYQIVVKLAF